MFRYTPPPELVGSARGRTGCSFPAAFPRGLSRLLTLEESRRVRSRVEKAYPDEVPHIVRLVKRLQLERLGPLRSLTDYDNQGRPADRERIFNGHHATTYDPERHVLSCTCGYLASVDYAAAEYDRNRIKRELLGGRLSPRAPMGRPPGKSAPETRGPKGIAELKESNERREEYDESKSEVRAFHTEVERRVEDRYSDTSRAARAETLSFQHFEAVQRALKEMCDALQRRFADDDGFWVTNWETYLRESGQTEEEYLAEYHQALLARLAPPTPHVAIEDAHALEYITWSKYAEARPPAVSQEHAPSGPQPVADGSRTPSATPEPRTRRGRPMSAATRAKRLRIEFIEQPFDMSLLRYGADGARTYVDYPTTNAYLTADIETSPYVKRYREHQEAFRIRDLEPGGGASNPTPDGKCCELDYDGDGDCPKHPALPHVERVVKDAAETFPDPDPDGAFYAGPPYMGVNWADLGHTAEAGDEEE